MDPNMGPHATIENDPFINEIITIINGHIGDDFNDAENKKYSDEGKRRFIEKLPPGYKDGDKNSDKALGDFFIWRQII